MSICNQPAIFATPKNKVMTAIRL